MLLPTWDRAAAEAFLRKAIRTQGFPENITSDQSSSHTAAIQRDHGTHKTAIMIRHGTYLTTIVEHEHRAVQRMTRPMLGVKSVEAVCGTIAGIEVMPAIRKGQVAHTMRAAHTPAEPFYSRAA